MKFHTLLAGTIHIDKYNNRQTIHFTEKLTLISASMHYGQTLKIFLLLVTVSETITQG